MSSNHRLINNVTYDNGCKGSRYVPRDNDMHLISHVDLTKNTWLQFGCIECIREKCIYEDLEEPIKISVKRNGA